MAAAMAVGSASGSPTPRWWPPDHLAGRGENRARGMREITYRALESGAGRNLLGPGTVGRGDSPDDRAGTPSLEPAPRRSLRRAAAAAHPEAGQPLPRLAAERPQAPARAADRSDRGRGRDLRRHVDHRRGGG